MLRYCCHNFCSEDEHLQQNSSDVEKASRLGIGAADARRYGGRVHAHGNTFQDNWHVLLMYTSHSWVILIKPLYWYDNRSMIQ